MSEHTPLTEAVIQDVLTAHRLITPVQCRCGWRETDPFRDLPTHEAHVARILAVRMSTATADTGAHDGDPA